MKCFSGVSAVADYAGPSLAVAAAVRPNVHIARVELVVFIVQLLSLKPTPPCPNFAPSTRPFSVPWYVAEQLHYDDRCSMRFDETDCDELSILGLHQRHRLHL